MFEDSLMESTRHFSKRRGWITLLSSGLQMFAVAILVILPLLRTSALSPRYLTQIFPAPPLSAPPSPGNHPRTGNTDSGNRTAIIEVINNFNARKLIIGPEPVGPPPIDVAQICTRNCGSLIPGFPYGPSTGPAAVLAPQPPKGPIQISRFDPGQVIRRIEPIYPPLARAARVQGTVVLHAIISRQGTVEKLEVASGHPMLDRAAIEAVSQWLFRPYILNGQPIEVETQITVNFVLGGS